MRNNKGITLIALVVTIIVLLILAGVAIAMITGRNSILDRGQSTKAYNAIGAVKDEISLQYNSAYAEFMRQKYDSGEATVKTTAQLFADGNGATLKAVTALEKHGVDSITVYPDSVAADTATVKVRIQMVIDGTYYYVDGTLANGNTTAATFTWGSINEAAAAPDALS